MSLKHLKRGFKIRCFDLTIFYIECGYRVAIYYKTPFPNSFRLELKKVIKTHVKKKTEVTFHNQKEYLFSLRENKIFLLINVNNMKKKI